MDRVALVKERLEQVSAVARMARDAGPPCRGCVYCGDEKPTPVCHHLVYLEPRFDAAIGTLEGQSLRLVNAARSDTGYCGPEGLLFEPKGLLWRLRRIVVGQRATAIYTGAVFFALILGGHLVF